MASCFAASIVFLLSCDRAFVCVSSSCMEVEITSMNSFRHQPALSSPEDFICWCELSPLLREC